MSNAEKIEKLRAKATELHGAWQLDEAERLYRRILELHRTDLKECRLKRMKLAIFGKTFDGKNGFSPTLDRQRDTGAYGLAVEQHRADAALGLETVCFRSRKADLLAKHVEK